MGMNRSSLLSDPASNSDKCAAQSSGISDRSQYTAHFWFDCVIPSWNMERKAGAKLPVITSFKVRIYPLSLHIITALNITPEYSKTIEMAYMSVPSAVFKDSTEIWTGEWRWMHIQQQGDGQPTPSPLSSYC